MPCFPTSSTGKPSNSPIIILDSPKPRKDSGFGGWTHSPKHHFGNSSGTPQ